MPTRDLLGISVSAGNGGGDDTGVGRELDAGENPTGFTADPLGLRPCVGG